MSSSSPSFIYTPVNTKLGDNISRAIRPFQYKQSWQI